MTFFFFFFLVFNWFSASFFGLQERCPPSFQTLDPPLLNRNIAIVVDVKVEVETTNVVQGRSQDFFEGGSNLKWNVLSRERPGCFP